MYFLSFFYALAYPHLINHIVTVIWGSAPASHLKVLITSLNNMLRVILGVKWTDGRPNLSTGLMYRRSNVLKVESIFKYCLFKLLKRLLDGGCPEMFSYLLEPHLSLRNYETRNGMFRHPALVCEVERRSLPYQLINFYDSIPADLLNQNFNVSVKIFRRYLLNQQQLSCIMDVLTSFCIYHCYCLFCTYHNDYFIVAYLNHSLL